MIFAVLTALMIVDPQRVGESLVLRIAGQPITL